MQIPICICTHTYTYNLDSELYPYTGFTFAGSSVSLGNLLLPFSPAYILSALQAHPMYSVTLPHLSMAFQS